MKIPSFLLFLSLFSLALTAQESTKENWLHAGLNVFMPYQNKNSTEFTTSQNSFQTTYLYEEKAAIHLGVGWQQIREDGWFRNYELTGLTFSSQDDVTVVELTGQGFAEPIGGHELTRMAFYSRIEYGKIFAEDREARILPGLSVSIDPYYQFIRIIPKTSAGFPRSVTSSGLTFRAIPGLTFQLNPSLQLAVKVPIGLNNLELEYHRIDNPILIETERKTYRTTNQLGLYDLQGTLGLNFRI